MTWERGADGSEGVSLRISGGGRAFQTAGIAVAKSLRQEHATGRPGGRVVEGEIRRMARGQS